MIPRRLMLIAFPRRARPCGRQRRVRGAGHAGRGRGVRLPARRVRLDRRARLRTAAGLGISFMRKQEVLHRRHGGLGAGLHGLRPRPPAGGRAASAGVAAAAARWRSRRCASAAWRRRCRCRAGHRWRLSGRRAQWLIALNTLLLTGWGVLFSVAPHRRLRAAAAQASPRLETVSQAQA